MEDNDKDDNDDKGISALELDRVLGFSRGHQGHWPLDDDGNAEEYEKVEDDEVEDNKVEDNYKDNNNKDDNNDKGISALGIDRDLEFLNSGSPWFL